MIGKAEWTQGEANPRFIVTSLRRPRPTAAFSMRRSLRPRRDREPDQGMPGRPRSPTVPRRPRCAPTNCGSGSPLSPMSFICAVRRIGLAHTQFAEATCGTIRLKLLNPPASSASARDASSSRSPRPVPTPTNGAWPPPAPPKASPRRRQSRQHPRPPETQNNPTHPRKQAAGDARAQHSSHPIIAKPRKSARRLRNAG